MSQDRPGDGGRVVPEAPTEAFEARAGEGAGFEPGQVLGERYRIVGRLGAGGMGEVWRAFDLKLRVEVALKALRSELLKDESRLELLRSEVRAAREVTSPNVCRIFDLVELDGQELVSMEYVDGTTLLEVLRDKAPLDAPEAQEIASQFLAGLEAIHRAGLVHRDVKPENIMVTRTGRVVLMDFGLARSSEEGAGTVSGTPAYMAPEQARGITDPRSDLFSAGVILAEMVSPEGVRDFESRTSVWNGIRAEPVQVPDSPWAPVVKKAVAKEPDDRFASAHELTRALEEVAFRVLDETGLEPYPGLSAFDEKDAEYFFGREAEVEAVWQRLQSSQLLGIIGASGAGKSSFLGAGLIPAKPDSWSIVRCTPGSAAVASLRRAVIREIEGEAEAIKALAAGSDESVVGAFASWRSSHDHALLIVDQFEELFTQNSDEEQQGCAELLGSIALDADVHVLLSMRDDFLLRCHDHDELAPIFSELTPLKPPVGGALRRAVVQPALRCGYRFEDEELADEILAEVEGERGALPLLAFALARLWEKRDRENGLITRQAYRDIGGVGGALAQHAETLMERLGPERHGVVRELFRNLVTAQGTRAARETVELLSVFRDDVGEAEEVLHALVDARLLTSYEVPSDDGPGRQRVEVIHESLLRAWPRLVRWQAQDAEGALLRDQLRHAAAAWDEHGRPEDLLWTGSTYREYLVWRERYPGGLTELEQAFARAMTALATRRRRRRRIAAASALIVATVIAAVFAGLWRRSVLETRRAEASKLLALGELEINTYPTAALAWATASLELVDNLEGRLLALRALSKGPPVTVLQGAPREVSFRSPVFSRNGEWLATRSGQTAQLWNQDGRPPLVIGEKLSEDAFVRRMAFASDEILITELDGGHRWWLIPEVTEPARTENDRGWLKAVRGDGYFSYTGAEGAESIRWWPFDAGTPRLVGSMAPWNWLADEIDSQGSWLAYTPMADQTRVSLRSLGDWRRPPRLLGTHNGAIRKLSFHPDGGQVAALDESGEVRIWPTLGSSPEPALTFIPPGLPTFVDYGPGGSWLAVHGMNDSGLPHAWLVDLQAPLGTAPLELRRTEVGFANPGQMAFHPSGDWLAASDLFSVGFWPLNRQYPWVLNHGGRVVDVAFSPDGRWLLSVSIESESQSEGQVRAWPLDGQNGGEYRVLLEQPTLVFFLAQLAVDPTGAYVAIGSQEPEVVHLMPLAGGPIRVFECSQPTAGNYRIAFSPDGRLLAAAPTGLSGQDMGVQVWDVETGDTQTLDPVRGFHLTSSLRFRDERRLVWTGTAEKGQEAQIQEIEFDLETGVFEVISTEPGMERWRRVSRTGSVMLSVRLEPPMDAYDTDLYRSYPPFGRTERLVSHGDDPWGIAVDPSERWIVTGGVRDGSVRVGPVSGEQPRLLIGHEGWVQSVEFSPDGQWIASGGDDRTVRVWPMPNLSTPPLHTLPHDELIAKLKTLTNLQAVRDEESSTGWKVEVGPFPGWQTVPEW